MKHTVLICSPYKRNRRIVDEVQKECRQYRAILVDCPADLLQKSKLLDPHSWVFFPHWSERIPSSILQRFICVGFHMTDLPYGRGGSPLQNLVLRGHKETMMSAFRVTEIMDGGPVYLKKPLSLVGSAEQILRRASDVIAKIIIEIIQNKIQPIPQEGVPLAFTRRHPSQSELSEVKDANHLYDLIRIVDAEGYPAAFVKVGDKKLEFRNAKLHGTNVLCELTVADDGV